MRFPSCPSSGTRETWTTTRSRRLGRGRRRRTEDSMRRTGDLEVRMTGGRQEGSTIELVGTETGRITGTLDITEILPETDITESHPETDMRGTDTPEIGGVLLDSGRGGERDPGEESGRAPETGGERIPETGEEIVPETGEETTRGNERQMTRDIGGGKTPGREKTPGRGKTRETSIGMNPNLMNLESDLWRRVRREWRRIRSLV